MSTSIEDIWQRCIKVNATIGKHKEHSIFCSGGLWGVQALSAYGGSKPEVLTSGHATIFLAIQGFQQYLIDFLNSSTKELDEELQKIEDAKEQTQNYISILLDD